MNVKIQTRQMELSPTERNVIERKSRKARRMLPTYRSPDLELHVSLERLSKGKQFQTVLVLTTPQTAIRVEDIADSVTRSIVGAFDDLLRKIKKFKSQLNRERYWQRDTARVSGKAAVVTQPTEDLESAISTHLDKIENYIRRELYHRALVDHFPPGVLQPQALVDEVFLDVSSRVRSKPENVSMEQWMFQMARDTVSRKIEELEKNRDQPHLEEAAEPPERWDDEVLNFYQPDEALRLEDLVRDNHSDSPEELLAREETEEAVQKIIAGLTPSVRESFVLFALEGFNSDEVAMITGKAPDQVLNDVERARSHLRQHLSV